MIRRSRRDNANLRRLKKIGELMNDKGDHFKVALLGNSQTILKHESPQGEAIDNHDLVVRLNNVYPSNIEFQGSRTDLMLLSPPGLTTKLMWIPKASFRAKAIVLMSPSTFRVGPIDFRHLLAFYPIDRHEVLTRKLGARPSTGAMAIDLLSSLFGPEKIHLYGFDFWESPSQRGGEKTIGPHDPKREREYAELCLEGSNIH